jgi:hypothetical protein
MSYLPKVSLKISRLDKVLDGMANNKKKDKEKEKAADVAEPAPSETMAEVTTSPKAAAGGGEQQKSRTSRELMENFLTKAATPSSKRPGGELSPGARQQQKKAAQDEDRPMPNIVQDQQMEQEIGGEEDQYGTPPQQQEGGEDEEEKQWREQMMVDIVSRTGISPQQLDGVMEVVMAAFKLRVSKVAEQVAKGAVKMERARMEGEKEERKCRKSILIHKADKWVEHDVATQEYHLAERVTAAVNRVTQGMAHVTDAFTLGRWNEANPPTSVLVTFGSIAQKATFYKIVAKNVKNGNFEGEKMKAISCRDAFPKKHINEAKRLVQKGHVLKRNGQANSFRVIAQGPGCIPVLQVRDGQQRWVAFLGRELPAVAVQQPGRGARGMGGGRGGGQRQTGGNRRQDAPEQGGQQQGGGQWMTQQKGGRVTPAGSGYPVSPARVLPKVSMSVATARGLEKDESVDREGWQGGFPDATETVYMHGEDMDDDEERYHNEDMFRE